MAQGQRKGQERLSVTFSSQVTISFRGILMCDSQSIKEQTQTHFPGTVTRFLHPQGH